MISLMGRCPSCTFRELVALILLFILMGTTVVFFIDKKSGARARPALHQIESIARSLARSGGRARGLRPIQTCNIEEFGCAIADSVTRQLM